MKNELISLEIKRVEIELHRISAKIANATDLLQSAVEAKILLIQAQQELEELYTTLGKEDPNP